MSTIEVKLALVSFKVLTMLSENHIFYSEVIDKMINELNGLDIERDIENFRLQFQIEIKSDRELVRTIFPECMMCSHLFVMKSETDIKPFIVKRTEEYKQIFVDKEIYKDVDWSSDCLRDISQYIEKHVYDIMVAINIAYPGLFEIASGEVDINNVHYMKIPQINNQLINVYEEWLEKGWPKMGEVSFKDTWKWICEKTNYLNETCNLPVDRALNALSYSFNANNYENLFYTLLGIEALYNTDRSDGIMEQIRTKTTCLLGEPEKFKKRISNMYSVRSSFVHGNLNFPSKFNIYDAEEEFEKFIYKDYMPTVITAQSILLATLRELIKHNANEMIFSTNIVLK